MLRTFIRKPGHILPYIQFGKASFPTKGFKIKKNTFSQQSQPKKSERTFLVHRRMHFLAAPLTIGGEFFSTPILCKKEMPKLFFLLERSSTRTRHLGSYRYPRTEWIDCNEGANSWRVVCSDLLEMLETCQTYSPTNHGLTVMNPRVQSVNNLQQIQVLLHIWSLCSFFKRFVLLQGSIIDHQQWMANIKKRNTFSRPYPKYHPITNSE